MASNLPKSYRTDTQSFGESVYKNTYTSFAGTDIIATFTPRNGKPLVLGEIQTISYSIFRPTVPVYALGRANPKGIVKGPRAIAGSMIFTVFDRHVLAEMIRSVAAQNEGMGGPKCPKKTGDMKADELPPFDITISFMNEYGQSARMVIYDTYIVSEGQTMSIEDMITENAMQFIAMDIDLMKEDAYE